MIYFSLLHFNPFEVNVTFSSTPGQFLKLPLTARTFLFQFFGGTMVNLDHAPLCLNSLMLSHFFASQQQFFELLSSFYTRQALFEAYKILGSTDLLGNPVGLFSSFASGVTDFFYEPAKGIVTSPQAFGLGVARGTASLVKNSVFGVFNTVSKMTGALGKGVATLSFDDEYLSTRQERMRRQPKHVGVGALQGVSSLGMGLFDGITGIVLKPVEGAKKGGLKGFGKGVGKGMLGVVVKPLTGVLEFATKTTEGIRNTATYIDAKATNGQQWQREVRVRRYPCTFGKMNEMLVYDEHEAEGHYLLNKSGHIDENYLYHVSDSTTKMLYLLSSERLLIFKSGTIALQSIRTNTGFSTPILQHDIAFSEIKVDTSHAKVVLKNKAIPIAVKEKAELDVFLSKLFVLTM
jgi:hypothetical protein